ncbi:tRNA (cytidine(34)-2'-O)-methyltransferase [Lichenihabitans sp. Uapishka_5]|uniref:tRNA (cytidine(34)-2'-O)-methyltransferase n=1 Tax=Lichenihabitans sp. Uapishka_5 TaxID=3037302 RepID=UPI0029E81F7F|nr:tRNA (cytidine(34)-2'-O)-methyltransferase [Lichenihabitans sp. Uapishka_5]
MDHAALTLALYQPDIPQNAGTLLRSCACLGVAAALIEPAGFPTSDKHFRRAGMDYLDAIELVRHASFQAFQFWRTAEGPHRCLILLSTAGEVPYWDVAYRPGDVLMVGRESAGVPPAVHAAADLRVTVPMRPPFRSLNVAVAASMVMGEALRQLHHPAAARPTP